MDDITKVLLDLLEGLGSNEPALVQFIFPDAKAVNKQVLNVVNDGVLVICLGYQLQHVTIFLLGQIQTDYIETIIEKSGKNAGLGVAILG